MVCRKYKVVFHNLKFDYKMLAYHLGLKFNRMDVHDTMILHYLLDENDSHGLKQLALKYTDFGDYDSELDDFKKEYCSSHSMLREDFTYDLIPYDVISRYAAIDTAVTFELFEKFMPIVEKNEKLLFVYKTIMMPGILFLMDMEEVGIPMDTGRLQAAEKYLDIEVQRAKEEIYAFEAVKNFEQDSKGIFNPASVIQLRKVLFDYAGLSPTGKITKAGAVSTDAEVLEELSEDHPLPKAILKMRQLSKIQSSYITKILPELDRDGRIRTNFNLTFTTSGRLSSSGKFNAQQIPRDNPIIKACIVAPDGYVIVSQDLATAEVYYAAVLSKDKNLQAVFAAGGDLHATIAKMVFNLPCEASEVKKLYPLLRQAAKAITFGILYGSGPAKVAESVTKATGEYYSLEEAKQNIKDYFTKFSTLKKWLNTRKAFIETNGYTYSFFGRKRRLPNVFSSDKGIAAHDVRSGINMEIQSLASDMNLLGAIDTANEVKQKGLDANIFMLVHDSIVAVVREEHVTEYCEILKRNTQKDRGCSIPMFPVGVDQDIGKDYSFGSFEECYTLESGILSRI
jgi:DNA polymerase I-like protein with 3'-5' exonuclease and polymerase domains